MPSLANLAGRPGAVAEKPVADLVAEFEKSKQSTQKEVPDLLAAFERASRDNDRNKSDGVQGRTMKGIENDGPEKRR